MSRPLKDSIDYFSHDTDMSEDEKVQLLEFKYGLVGYAVYNKILERVYKTNMEFNLVSDDDYCLYSDKWRIEKEKLIEIISFMREKKLFPAENFVSNGIKKRIKKIKSERIRKRNYHKNKQLTGKVLDVQNTAKTPETTDFSTQSKVNKTKLNKSKLNINKEVEEGVADEITHLFATFFGKPPNLADRQTTESLLSEFGKEKTIQAFQKARDKLSDRINLGYIRGILNETGIKKNGTSSQLSRYSEAGKTFKVVGAD